MDGGEDSILDRPDDRNFHSRSWNHVRIRKQSEYCITCTETWRAYSLAQTPLMSYLVDAFTTHAASAIAASTIFRSVFGAFLPLAGPPLYSGLGLGWGNTVLAIFALLMAPIPWVVMKRGEAIRGKYAHRVY